MNRITISTRQRKLSKGLLAALLASVCGLLASGCGGGEKSTSVDRVTPLAVASPTQGTIVTTESISVSGTSDPGASISVTASDSASKPQPTLQLEADASGNWSGQFELSPGVSVMNFSAGKLGQSPATPLVVTVRRDPSSSERSAAAQAAKKKAASKLAAANKARAAEQRRKADQAAAAAQQRSACITVPNVVGTNHQGAQDTMQAAGLYSLAEEDATGQGRMLLLDRNWVVVSQNPTGGKCVSADTTITLSSKKIGE